MSAITAWLITGVLVLISVLITLHTLSRLLLSPLLPYRLRSIFTPSRSSPKTPDFNPTVTAGRRRGLRHRTYSDDDFKSAKQDEIEMRRFRMVSKPLPEGIKSAMKRCESSATESTGTGSESDTSSTAAAGKKTVRLVEPQTKADLTALREFWAAPSTVGGDNGGGGIAGYRRTRSIYTKGQGGTAVIKRPVVVVTPDGDEGSQTETDEEEEEEGDEENDSGSGGGSTKNGRTASPAAPQRVPRLSPPLQPSTPARNSSLTRTRGSSPSFRSSSPSFAQVKSASSSHGGLGARTTSPAGMVRRRRSPSNDPPPVTGVPASSASEKAVVTPRWIKAKTPPMAAAPSVGSQDVGDEAVEDEDGFEDVSDGSGSSTPTGPSGILAMTSLTTLAAPSIAAAVSRVNTAAALAASKAPVPPGTPPTAAAPSSVPSSPSAASPTSTRVLRSATPASTPPLALTTRRSSLQTAEGFSTGTGVGMVPGISV